MTRKFKLSLAFAVLMIGTLVLAQGALANATKQAPPAQDRERLGEKRLEILKEKLSLTDEQAEAIKTAMAEHRAKMEEVRNRTNRDPEAMKEAREEIRAAMEETMKSILTKEQYADWEILKAEWQKRRDERRQHRPRRGHR
ncbi:MAG: periplasmic heavy metal sensor [Gemmatimonadetes bacterium]|nr:MAG: periplasmic heavy metal sensor [Gemmatimonadota bacterium]